MHEIRYMASFDFIDYIKIFISSTPFVAAIAAIVAAYYAFKAYSFGKLPIVHATGTFIISTKSTTNALRDKYIAQADSFHTFQLLNVGRGPAKNITISAAKDIKGYFLEEINPHSFSLPTNVGTKELREVLRVHGQIFVRNKHELFFENDHKIGYFYIHFEDCEGKPYITKVKINRVNQADGELGESIKKNEGIEVWKIIENINEGI